MRERHFMEDENELPFLVSRNSHDESYSGSSESRFNFNNIPFSQFPSSVKRLPISSSHIRNIIGSIDVRSGNCICSIRQDDNCIRFNFILKNQYLISDFSARYGLYNSEMVFNHPLNNYDGLSSTSWAVSEINKIKRQTGLGFDGFSGGFKYHFDGQNLTIYDDFKVLAYFSGEDYYSDSYSYKVDFGGRKFEKYHVHPWSELFESSL